MLRDFSFSKLTSCILSQPGLSCWDGGAGDGAYTESPNSTFFLVTILSLFAAWQHCTVFQPKTFGETNFDFNPGGPHMAMYIQASIPSTPPQFGYRDPYSERLKEEGSWHRVGPAFTAVLIGTRDEKGREVLIRSFSLVSIDGEMVEGDRA